MKKIHEVLKKFVFFRSRDIVISNYSLFKFYDYIYELPKDKYNVRISMLKSDGFNFEVSRKLWFQRNSFNPILYCTVFNNDGNMCIKIRYSYMIYTKVFILVFFSLIILWSIIIPLILKKFTIMLYSIIYLVCFTTFVSIGQYWAYMQSEKLTEAIFKGMKQTQWDG